ncbi:sigma factor-like helix-turn-helix DNA-binding protein [Corynebacterium sp.]|uniref:sigma factor-like helix-turn-helix DNA-binding protein n=1 Tax=Corynebacterium sp. TaxID=1720 RepID=UPI003B3B9FB0
MTWVGPIATTNLADDPADAAVRRETVRLAFIAALQYLPPRQRVVLILRDVLAWRASECAELLEVSVASVNSALARARPTLRARVPAEPECGTPFDEDLLRRYVGACEAFDVGALVGLLAEDASFTMPCSPCGCGGAGVSSSGGAVRVGRIAGLTHFMGSGVFAELGLPENLPENFPGPDR